MSLAALAEAAGTDAGDASGIAVTGVSASSGSTVAGDLYVGLPGARTHGARFAAEAARAGAVALLTDAEGAGLAAAASLPTLVVQNPRAVLGAVSARAYGEPASALRLIGVTGTQGKTTTTQLIAAAASGAGLRSAVIGTMGTWIDGEPVGSLLTTPEAPDLHALFAVMRERGIDLCAMEVSSHALVMGRVDGVVFDVAVFLNLGRDHLDFHADLEDYFRAKALLFGPDRTRRALVNGDDPRGRELAARRLVPTETFSTTSTDADWSAVPDPDRSTPSGSAFTATTPAGEQVSCAVRLPGAFNVSNALAALAATVSVGADPQAAAAGIGALESVPGRMERVPNERGIDVIVDYAHKPDAVEAALRALRPVTPGRLVIVIGAGGDRDPGKRPLMGEIAARLADEVVVTDDNPRSEPPAQIRAALLAGARRGPARTLEVGDRAEAIAAAIGGAQPGDTVLIAGKGHETGQEVEGQVHAFDDRAVARRALALSAEVTER